MKILFFIQSIAGGGRGRRFVELLSYLSRKSNYECLVLTFEDKISYPKIYGLDIKLLSLNCKTKHDIFIPYKIYKICKEYNPDIIHVWNFKLMFYALFAIKTLKIPVVNSQIADAIGSSRISKFANFINKINFKFSNIICSNSYAGLKAYNQDKDERSVVVYNGLDPNRFVNLEDMNVIKDRYGIKTKYTVVMTASYSQQKDWQRFIDVAREVVKQRGDITFIGVGPSLDDNLYNFWKKQVEEFDTIQLQGRCSEVENLVNACDVGVLFSTQGEGVSNTILEYLALGKPVVVDKSGGTPEFIEDGVNGFFADGKTNHEVANLIVDLIDNEVLRVELGEKGKQTIQDKFTLDHMGEGFEAIYSKLV